MSDLRRVFRSPSLAVYLDPTLELMVTYVDRDNATAYVSDDTWDELAKDPEVMTAFRRSARDGVSGLRSLRGDQAVPGADRLAVLGTSLASLVAEAASLSGTALSERQMQELTFRHTQAREQVAALEAELAHARSMVDLAADVLCDL